MTDLEKLEEAYRLIRSVKEKDAAKKVYLAVQTDEFLQKHTSAEHYNPDKAIDYILRGKGLNLGFYGATCDDTDSKLN